ncbi:MAG: ABC-F family ATP-binding cassette domain-containing protein [Deltaproteobacteria bacterium]|nr:ABC-F family ATP-binding cassette domain-containing protein [Deltaproteobacteria bacterium]
MSLVSAENLSLHFGSKTILDGANFRLVEGDRIGLVGPNGSGKSTLLRLFLKQATPDAGRIVISRGTRLGHLPQDVADLPDAPLREFVLAAAPGRETIGQSLEAAEADLADATDPETQIELAQRLHELHEERERFDTLFAPHEAEKILDGLGFTVRDLARPLSEFSGGWRMRAALAALLFTKPDLLLLDEPTNHLDVPSLLWFENFLTSYRHAFVMISHDRDFLNAQIRRVWSFEVEGLRTYTGNLENYLEQREAEEQTLAARAKNQERAIAQTERFIRRFRAKASKARQVQSKIRALEKIERVEIRTQRKTLDFEFPPAERSGRDVIKVRGIAKAFGPLRLFNNLNLTVSRGERVAIIGRNGAGKTTLLRMLANELDPDAGSIELGHNVTPGYYAQHHADQLSSTNTVLREVWDADPSASQTRVRTVCGLFLFSGDEVEKSCRVLSGGERARVVLAKLLMRPGNLLLMDEPTNHLDLFASETLAEALSTFDGTLVFVSHNRSLVNALATVIWDLDGRGVNIYPGNLDEYLDHQRRVAERLAAPPNFEEPTDRADESRVSRKEARRLAAQQLQERRRVLAPIERDIAKLEERIADIEKRQTELSALLADPDFYAKGEGAADATREFMKNREKIDELMARWEHKQAEHAQRVRAVQYRGCRLGSV